MSTPSTSQLAGSLGKGDSEQPLQYVVAKENRTGIDFWIDKLSDSMGSILVKETRQAIKSRYFFGTLVLLVLATVVWAFISLSPGRDGYNESTLGAVMMCGFLWILGVPVMLSLIHI